MRKEWMTAVVALAGMAGLVHAQGLPAKPSAIEAVGKGAQVYVCKAAPGGSYAWALQGPDATLQDASGHVIGKHFAGPTWQANDGSRVVAKPLNVSPSPNPGAIPWLVLRAISHVGAGQMASVEYVVRTRTEGGMAPASGCDAGRANAEVRVPYGAVYLFFRG